MKATIARKRIIHPLHAMMLAGCLPLFLGALFCDWAYSSTYEVQWLNFASWLNAGALVLAGFALLWATIDFFRADVARDRRSALYLLTLVTGFVLGFLNAFMHGKDAWATMPEGLILSVLTFLLVLAATWLGFSTLRAGALR